MGEPSEKLSRGTIAAYASPAIPISALGLPLVVYLPPFYADDVGIGLATVGTIFMLTRLWDVVTDPALGILSDKLGTRFGRRRPWIALSVPILLLCVWRVFMPPAGAGPGYLLGWMIGLYVGWTLLTISHMSWGAELSPRYHERTAIHGWREFALIFGMFTVLMLPAIIERTLGGGGYAKVASMGWFILILLPLTVGLALWRVPERPPPVEQRVGFRTGLRLVLQNRPMRRVLIADMLVGLGPGITGSLYVFFVRYVLELEQHTSLLLLVYFVSGFLGVPMWIRISYRFGKHKTLAGSVIYAALALPFLAFVRPGQFWIYFFANIAYGLAYGAGPFLLRSITADICDHDRLQSGNQRTGLFYSLLMMTNKIGFALSVGITYWLLDLIGFRPGQPNTPEAITGLRWLFVALPVAALLPAGLIMWRFPLDEKAQRQLRAKLAKQKAAG